MKLLHAATLGLALALCAASARAADPAVEKELTAATQAVLEAQIHFDQKALDALLAPDYVEVSPLGDVDERAEVLSFYTPEARAQMLAAGMEPLSTKIEEPRIRVYGDQAIVIAKDTAALKVKGVAEERSMRMLFHFRKLAGKWLLQTMQVTWLKPSANPAG